MTIQRSTGLVHAICKHCDQAIHYHPHDGVWTHDPLAGTLGKAYNDQVNGYYCRPFAEGPRTSATPDPDSLPRTTTTRKTAGEALDDEYERMAHDAQRIYEGPPGHDFQLTKPAPGALEVLRDELRETSQLAERRREHAASLEQRIAPLISEVAAARRELRALTMELAGEHTRREMWQRRALAARHALRTHSQSEEPAR